jgi:predicted metalloendopeptidase
MISRVIALVLTGTVLISCSDKGAPSPSGAHTEARLDFADLDKTVGPQNDPYKHVNNGWLARTAIPPDRGSYGGFDEAIDRTEERLRAIAEEMAKGDRAPAESNTQKIGAFFAAFMDEERANQLGRRPLEAELARIDSISTRADLARLLARLQLINVPTLVTGYIDADAQDPERSVLYLFQSGLGLPDRDYYLKDDPKLKEYRDKYRSYLARILTLSGEPEAADAAARIFDLELRLARTHWTNVESRDAVKTYNKVLLGDLEKQFPGFDWSAWVQELGIRNAGAVIVAQPSYFRAMAETVAQTPVEHWKPYLKFHTTSALAPYLSSAFVESRFDFYGRTLHGLEQIEPRWKRAVRDIDAALGELLGKEYVARHFKPDARARMDRLIEDLRAAFREGIDELDWMGPETKKEAHAKLAAFRPKVGYPAKWRDYSKVEIREDDLFGNIVRARTAENQFQLGKAGRPIDPDDWVMTPQTVNAYYNPVRNEIVFPAAILQPPFFDMAADDAVNYGAIGAVIGHEMGHGFDDQGRRYDAKGRLRDWWTPKDSEEFARRAKGLVAQYSAMEVLPGLHVNGELTLGENIGDVTGVVMAHRAYVLSLAGKEPPVVNGISGHHRFFFGWVRAWRSKYRDDALRQLVLTNPHAPEMTRANGPLRNVNAFYRVFALKEGDGMWLPPAQRVNIW